MGKTLRILVVDDDRDNADSLAELFTMDGHVVEVAYDGEAAIAAYRDGHYDVAFMDVMMPGKNGVESFLEIKRLKPGARVYMMTGYSVEQLLQQALDNGALGIFNKPVDLRRIVGEVESLQQNGIVLIAEDDPDLGPELQEVIEMSGRVCELVRNGQQALDRMAAGGVDVMILDLNMPLINGIEVYTRLRAEGRAVPTVIITACRDQHADALAALSDIELTGILNKPFDPGELLARLDRLAA